MNIENFTANDMSYAKVSSGQSDCIGSSCLPTLVEGEELSVTPVKNKHPINYRYDKRKSSPAILGLPLGHDSQLNLYLSQQRNSIEAAVLLANFNRLLTFPKQTETANDQKVLPQHWQDDMSIPTKNKNAWSNSIGNHSSYLRRRYSYDANQNWNTMPESFLDRPDLLCQPLQIPSTASTCDLEHPLHPLAQSPTLGIKRELLLDRPSPYFSFPPNHTPTQPKPKRSRTCTYDYPEDEALDESEYPEMTTQDLELARQDPEARPRRQKLRFLDDIYTPNWVRYNSQLKEGLCDTCKPGKWLQLKNSAYWYHKQFYHGISSVSGAHFIPPLETRWVDQDLLEGLCHQCKNWLPVSNIKRKSSVLWYRHAHKCHVYNKPKVANIGKLES